MRHALPALTAIHALVAATLAMTAPTQAQAAPVARSVPGAPDAAESVQSLLRQARFLMAKHRADLARYIVQKARAVNPEDPDVVLMSADLSLQAGQTDDAQALLTQLQRTHPGTAQLAELDRLVRVYTVDRLQLQQLSKLADDGRRTDEARLLARQLFPEGRAPGLLSDQFGWLLDKPADTGTRQTPNRRGSGTDPAVLARQRGYEALSVRDHARADSEFRSALKRRPDDASSLGGLGIVRLRDSRYAEAEQYFARAIAHETVDAAEWHALAATARYWRLTSEGRALLARNEPVQAATRLQSAVPLQPQQTEARILLAEALAAQGRSVEAEQAYGQVLAIDPKDTRALNGQLALRMARAGDAASQQAVLDEASQVGQRTGTPAADLIDAGAVRAAAQRELAAGHVDAAERLLARSVTLLPADAWLRHDLARLYQQQGRGTQAQQVMEDGVRVAPADADMRHAAALIAFSNDNEVRALEHLSAIPPSARTATHDALAHSVAFEAAMRQQRTAQAQGDPQARDAALSDARAHLDGRVDRRLRVASAESNAGRLDRVRADLDAIDPATLPPADALTWAELSADAGRDDAAQAMLSRLARTQAGKPEQDGIIAAQARIAERQIEQARREGRTNDAQRIASSALQPWMNASAPRSARLAQAELWLAAGDPAQALPLLDGLLAQRSAAEPAIDVRLLRARALAGVGRTADASRELNALVAERPQDAQVRLEAARLARSTGDYNMAMAHLQAVAAPALLPSSAGGAAGVPAAATDPAVQSAIDAIEARRQPRVEMAYSTYSRSGSAGMSQLRAQEVPVAVYWPIGYQGNAFVRLDAVRLDAGTLPAGTQADLFGTVLTGTALTQPTPQQAEGRNVGIGWEDDRRRIDIGLTGLGMPVTNVVGGWRQTFDTPTTDITLDVSRRPQTSSLLAYAGANNPGPGGGTWGGVTNTSASLRLARTFDGAYSLATTLRLGLMDGKHVQRNPYWQWRTVVDRDWLRGDNWRLNVGVAGMLWHFEHNAGEYTWGHGGYYSPQRYASISLPVDLTARTGPVSYQLRGALTHTWTDTASAAYYPLDPALQNNPSYGNPTYNGGRGGGFGSSLRGAVEWQLASRWIAGAAFDVERSSDYAPNRASIYLRHYLKQQGDALSVPPRPVVPYSQF